MSEENPTQATEDPPPFVNGESAATDKKNNAEKYGIEDSREASVTSNNADEVKNGCENGTEGEDANIVEANDTEGHNSGCDNVVSAEDVTMVDTQHEANIEGVDIKMVDTQHEAKIEAADVKMVGTQDVKMGHTKHATPIQAEEDACKDKEVGNGDNQHAKATEGEGIKMVEAKADARNSEAQDRKEDVCQKTNSTSIEDKDMQIVDKEDMYQKQDTEGKNEDCQDAKVANTDEMEIVEAKTYVRNTDAQGDEKEELEDMVEEKKNNANIEDDGLKTVDREVASHKEDEGDNEDSHDANVEEADKIMTVTSKSDAGNTEVEENEKTVKEDACLEEHTNIEDDGVKTVDKEVASHKEGEGNNLDNHEASVAEGDEIMTATAKTNAVNTEVEENEKKEENAKKTEEVTEKVQMEDNVEENKNDANIDAENVMMVDIENACQNKDKERKTDGSQDANAAEGEGIVMVEAKSDAGNAGVKEIGKKEEKEEQNAEKADGANNKADNVKIVDKEDACQKEDMDKERKDVNSHSSKAEEGEEIMVVETKSAVVLTEVKENGKKEADENMTEEKQNDNKEGSICVEKQDEDRMEPTEAHKQDGLTQEEKCGFDKHGMSDREETVKESQEVLKREEKGNVDKQEVDDTEQNVKEKQEELEEEGRVGSSNHEVAKDEQDGTAEKQEEEKPDVNVSAEKKENQEFDNIQNAKESEGEDMKIVEGNADAVIPEAIENTKRVEMEDNVEENRNDANIDAENVIMVDDGNACQNKDKERKTNGSQDANAAEGVGIMMVETKSDAGNAGVKENGKKEEKEEQNAEKADGVNNKADNVKSVDKEDACQKEDIDKERKNENSHSAKAAEGEIMVAETKSAVVHAGVKENGKKEADENTTEEKQNDNKEGEKLDVNVAAEKKEKQDVKLTAEKKDKTQDVKVAAEKKEEVNENVAFEKNAEIVIEIGVSEKYVEMETNGNTTVDKQEGKKDKHIDDASKQEGQKKGAKRSNADMEEAANGRASKFEKDGEGEVEEAGESDNNMGENKHEAPKSKKARIVKRREQRKGYETTRLQVQGSKGLAEFPKSLFSRSPAACKENSGKAG
ncbi:hypothetical protein HU200_022689 [Digitaria exilis]|uniref:Uncharacterized protein n=1 Tax=Digitaria exilis TaxID=1010633 RepID=A0A835C442_9POAL|nr:hypothetical protein HU200_022689 [Digitaria exilis]